MSLNVADGSSVDACIAKGALDDGTLCEAVGSRDAVGMAVLVHRRAADHGADGIAVGNRISESLEYDDTAAFAAHEAVGALIERLAAAIGSQHVHARRGDREVRPENQIDAASDRQR